ncbi:DUF4411 family protein [Anoxybacteroides rupiense]|uniref:DUF4411 family protein n=1 Tax=Anoxybacteroides rupiense TaxID=311460 RepID=UPI0036703CAD
MADSWLIAFAKTYHFTVVTDRNSKRRTLIPNVCRAFNISYTNTFDMPQRLGVKF